MKVGEKVIASSFFRQYMPFKGIYFLLISYHFYYCKLMTLHFLQNDLLLQWNVSFPPEARYGQKGMSEIPVSPLILIFVLYYYLHKIWLRWVEFGILWSIRSALLMGTFVNYVRQVSYIIGMLMGHIHLWYRHIKSNDALLGDCVCVHNLTKRKSNL